MKQQYRDLIMTIAEQDKKLATAKQMQNDAQAALSKANEYVSYGVASLAESNAKLAEMERKLFS